MRNREWMRVVWTYKHSARHELGASGRCWKEARMSSYDRIRENSHKGTSTDFEVDDRFIHEKRRKEKKKASKQGFPFFHAGFFAFRSFLSRLTCHLLGQDVDHCLGNSSP